jgi:hypothetical protein
MAAMPVALVLTDRVATAAPTDAAKTPCADSLGAFSRRKY